MLVDGFQPAMNILVLALVKVLQLLGFSGGSVNGDRATAITLTGGVGADQVDFARGLETGRELVRVVFARVARGGLRTFDVGQDRCLSGGVAGDGIVVNGWLGLGFE